MQLIRLTLVCSNKIIEIESGHNGYLEARGSICRSLKETPGNVYIVTVHEGLKTLCYVLKKALKLSTLIFKKSLHYLTFSFILKRLA